jgi:hypothetical protein
MVFWITHYASMIWLHFNLAKKYDPNKSKRVPKSFFSIYPFENMNIYGFVFFASKQTVSSPKAYGYLRLARLSFVLFIALGILAVLGG